MGAERCISDWKMSRTRVRQRLFTTKFLPRRSISFPLKAVYRPVPYTTLTLPATCRVANSVRVVGWTATTKQPLDSIRKGLVVSSRQLPGT